MDDLTAKESDMFPQQLVETTDCIKDGDASLLPAKKREAKLKLPAAVNGPRPFVCNAAGSFNCFRGTGMTKGWQFYSEMRWIIFEILEIRAHILDFKGP